MPEGPSIIILKEEANAFVGKKVIEVSGNSKQDIQRAAGKKIIDLKSWGKHFLICFPEFTIKIHFMLFGSYRINEDKESPPRLSLRCKNGIIRFYACSVKLIEEDLDTVYEWSADIMSNAWDERRALKKIQSKDSMLLCDALLDQHIFAGSGNIIKNEVMYRTRLHPLNEMKDLPLKEKKGLIKAVREYAFDFLLWKKAYVLKKHWLAHTKKICTRCNIPLVKAYLGKTNRRTFYCENCQQLYPQKAKTKR